MAGAQNFKHGGLRRLIAELDQRSVVTSNTAKGRMSLVGDELSDLARLRSTIEATYNLVCSTALQGNAASISTAISGLKREVRFMF